MCFLRFLELTFFLYFISHIPITLLFDSQAVYPRKWFPAELLNITEWYVKELKDPYFADPPIWYMCFVAVEQTIQLPFFFVASYAFWRGGCKWMRTPTLIYASHVATTTLPMLASFGLDDFAKLGRVGPSTFEERMILVAIYMPYFAIPILLILTMLFSDTYKASLQAQAAKASPKKKHHKAH